MTNAPEFSNLIRELRKRLGLSQEQLARQLGISFQTVNRWENGRTIPSQMAMTLIEQLLKDMGVQGQDLWEQYFSDHNLEPQKLQEEPCQ